MQREPDSFFRCRREPGVRHADDRHYPAVTTAGTVRLEPGERLLWRGRTGVAEYRFTGPMDDHDVRWWLPGPVDVVVTDRRVSFVGRDAGLDGVAAVLRRRFVRVRTGWAGHTVRVGPTVWERPTLPARPAGADGGAAAVVVGQVRWQWPYWLHVLPPAAGGGAVRGRRPGDQGRVLLVCKAYHAGGQPALVLCGGDIAGARAAGDLGNIIRAAVAGFRIGHAAVLGLHPREVAGLGSRMVGPVFGDGPGGGGQGTNLPGALMVGFLRHDEYRQSDATLLASPGGGLSVRYLARA